MVGYREATARRRAQRAAFAGGRYHTGDVATRDADGYITYVGRTDDVFKARDYRISPFELESVLIEHPAVAEAAVVPAPDAVRLAVPKAYVVLVAGQRAERRSWPPTSCGTRARIWRPTSGSGAWSSPSCPRRSAARSAGSSCATPRTSRPRPAARASIARRTSQGEVSATLLHDVARRNPGLGIQRRTLVVTLLARRQDDLFVRDVAVWNDAQQVADDVEPGRLLVVGIHDMPRRLFDVGVRRTSGPWPRRSRPIGPGPAGPSG